MVCIAATFEDDFLEHIDTERGAPGITDRLLWLVWPRARAPAARARPRGLVRWSRVRLRTACNCQPRAMLTPSRPRLALHPSANHLLHTCDSLPSGSFSRHHLHALQRAQRSRTQRKRSRTAYYRPNAPAIASASPRFAEICLIDPLTDLNSLAAHGHRSLVTHYLI